MSMTPTDHENLRPLARLSGGPEAFARLAPRLLALLQDAPEPEHTLHLLERLAAAGLHCERPFIGLAPATVQLLVQVFGVSPYLAEILIRDPSHLDALHDPALARPRLKRDYLRDLAVGLRALPGEAERLGFLRRFKEQELLRIGVRDLGKRASVEQTLVGLSSLAEALIQKAYEVCESSLRARHRRQGHRAALRRERAGFAVLGLGKLGGGELNFSSDVDLVYLYASDTEPASLRSALTIPLPEFFARLGRRLTSALDDVTDQGLVYRVDLRLRPEGRMGSVVHSLHGALDYYARRGATWERLALLKAWPVAGDRALAGRFLKGVQSFVYARRLDDAALAEVLDSKARIDARLRAEGKTHRNVKLGFGGIREIELVVQTLQVALGQRRPRLRQRHTLRALRALARHKVLSAEQERTLNGGYLFLRDLENKLQMVHGFQTHSLPAREAELRLCALRLGYRDGEGVSAEARLAGDYTRETEAVHRVFREVLHPRNPHFGY
jgi:glutamate-ammonia-ligase adenylyltransferase